MALSIFITISLFLFHVHIFIKKGLSFVQWSILFMVISIFVINYLTIMTLELKLLKTTEDHFLFIALILYRNLIIPLFVLIFSNAYLTISTWKKKLFLFMIIFTVMIAVEHLAVHFRLIEYSSWNFALAYIVILVYLVMGLGLAKLLCYLPRLENHQDDGL